MGDGIMIDKIASYPHLEIDRDYEKVIYLNYTPERDLLVKQTLKAKSENFCNFFSSTIPRSQFLWYLILNMKLNFFFYFYVVVL